MSEDAQCDNCGEAMRVLEETDEYRLEKCPNCGRYSLAASTEAFPMGAGFEIAAQKPFPDGKWVHVKPPSSEA